MGEDWYVDRWHLANSCHFGFDPPVLGRPKATLKGVSDQNSSVNCNEKGSLKVSAWCQNLQNMPNIAS